MPTPLGPVMKAWICPLVSRGSPYHLPRVVDPESGAIVSTECAEIGHAYAIRAGDEGMDLPVVSRGVPYHLPRVVDPVSVAIVSTECAKVGYFLAVKVNEKSYASGRGRKMRTQ